MKEEWRNILFFELQQGLGDFLGLTLCFEGCFRPSRSVLVRRGRASAPVNDFACDAAQIACAVLVGCSEVTGDGRPSIGHRCRGVAGAAASRTTVPPVSGPPSDLAMRKFVHKIANLRCGVELFVSGDTAPRPLIPSDTG